MLYAGIMQLLCFGLSFICHFGVATLFMGFTASESAAARACL